MKGGTASQGMTCGGQMLLMAGRIGRPMSPKQQSIGWSDDRVDRLKKLWGEGKSAAQIAGILKGNLTRSAVIGKVHRLGLSEAGRAKAAAPSTARTHVRPPKPGQQNRPGAVFGAVSIDNPEETERRRKIAQAENEKRLAAMAEPANDTALPLINRSRFQCSWPVGEPARPAEQMCCGQRVAMDANRAIETYCAKHAQKAVSRTLVGGKPDAKVYERSLRRFA